MVIENSSGNKFLQALKEVEPLLFEMQFKNYSSLEKGFACYIEYKRTDGCIVMFLYGPPQYEVEMIVHSPRAKFAFKDLLQLPAILAWVNDNIYAQGNGRDIQKEILWYIKLLKFSLPFIE